MFKFLFIYFYLNYRNVGFEIVIFVYEDEDDIMYIND